MTPSKCIAEYAREARLEEEEEGKEKVLSIIVRKTDTFWLEYLIIIALKWRGGMGLTREEEIVKI